MLAQSVQPRYELHRFVLPIRVVHQFVCGSGQKVKAVIEICTLSDSFEIVFRVATFDQIIQNKMTSAGGIIYYRRSLHISVVCDCREHSIPVDAHPGSTRFEISARKDPGMFSPVMCRFCGAAVGLVPIASKYQIIIRMLSIRKDDQTHGESVDSI